MSRVVLRRKNGVASARLRLRPGLVLHAQVSRHFQMLDLGAQLTVIPERSQRCVMLHLNLVAWSGGLYFGKV